MNSTVKSGGLKELECVCVCVCGGGGGGGGGALPCISGRCRSELILLGKLVDFG